MDIGITAIGTAVPEHSYNQMEIVEFLAQALHLTPAEKRRLASIHRATGIKKRHTVLDDFLKQKGDFKFFPNNEHESLPTTLKRMTIYKETALPLAVKAIQNCFRDLGKFEDSERPLDTAQQLPLGVTHLITVSCTGMYAPGLDIDIINHFSFPTTTHRVCINFMGCYGAFNALKTANDICKANNDAKVLVVCLELCSLHYQLPRTQDNILSTSIFADGAAAALVESTLSAHATTQNLSKNISNRPAYLSLKDFYCDIVPESQQAMAWTIADFGFDIILSAYVSSLIKSGIETFFNRFLDKKGLVLSDITHFAIHPGGLKILEACEQALGISRDRNHHSYEIFKNYGNMSSVTILFVLQRLWHDLKSKRKDEANNKKEENILCCAFGPGLTLESMLINVYV